MSDRPSQAHRTSNRPSPGRVLVALWLGVSQAIYIGVLLLVVGLLWRLSEGFYPFSALAGPNFGYFWSEVEIKASLPVLGLVVAVTTLLGIMVGSWKLWARRKHGWAVLVSSLPLALFSLIAFSLS